MFYTIKITYKVINLEHVPGKCIINKELKKKIQLNLHNRWIDILIN